VERRIGRFVWEAEREAANIVKHGVDFATASRAFLDIHRKIFTDSKHSSEEPRYFCIGRVGNKIVTVRFTYREGLIRIFGAGCWRRGRRYYEE
jgi:hypothetical protein